MRDSIESGGYTQRQAADKIGTSRVNLVYILNGYRRISPAMAIKLERAGYYQAIWWLVRQVEFDLQEEWNRESD